MDWKIELIFVPVTDVDRAKDFYVNKLGFNAGLGLTMGPGAQDSIQVVIPDADAVLADLRAKGVEAEGVDEQEWGRFVTLKDPDGNRWTLQQLPVYD